jgi:chaperonin GroES
MKIKPLAGYVLIEPLEAETKTAGGILLPDNAQEKPTQGKIISVGANTFDHGVEIKPEFKAGETVLYKKWGGDDVKMDGKELKLVKFDDVIAIMDGSTTRFDRPERLTAEGLTTNKGGK